MTVLDRAVPRFLRKTDRTTPFGGWRTFAALIGAAWWVSAPPAEAQTSDFQAWNALAVAGPVADESRLLLWFDGHARFTEDASRLGVSILRPALGWRARDGLDLWTGYARVVSRADGRANIEENRFWQQATFRLPDFFDGSFGGRSRLEQRFRPTGSDTGWRFRQFARWARPIGGDRLSLVVWDEIFLNANDTDWGQRAGFDQNRLFIGAAWRFSQSARFEAGYLNNILDTPTADVRVNHNLSLTFFWNL